MSYNCFDKKKCKEYANRRDNKTIHFYKGRKIECRSILDYMGKSADDFSLVDICKWNLYLETFVPRDKNFKGSYKETIIYCINVNGECYVGHTIDFNQRIKTHKSCVKFQSNSLYRALYNFGFENAVIDILEICCCKNVKDAIKHEQKHFDKIKASLNECPPAYQLKQNPYRK